MRELEHNNKQVKNAVAELQLWHPHPTEDGGLSIIAGFYVHTDGWCIKDVKPAQFEGIMPPYRIQTTSIENLGFYCMN